MLPNFLGGLKEYVSLSLKEIKERCKGISCPDCKGTEINHDGFYKRNVRTLQEKILIFIKRLYCKTCSRHFSILPCFLMRYKRYSLEVLEGAYESTALKAASANKSLLEISVGGSLVCPDFSTLYRMWQEVHEILEVDGDNIYGLAKELEPDFSPFSNPVYQQQLDRKRGRGERKKSALQWITAQMITKLTYMKLGSGFRPLSLLHFCSVFQTLSPP